MGRFFKRMFSRIAAFFRLSIIWFKRIIRFITVDVWNINMDDLSRGKARIVKDIKIIQVMLNTFDEQKMSFQISALSFQSTLAIVPMIAIALFFASGVGMSGMIKDFLTSYVSDTGLIDTVMRAADNIIKTSQSGLFGFISMLTFVWIVVWLMIQVERVFNNAWKVEKPRKWWRQIGVIIIIMILSPFVIALFVAGSVVYSNVLELIPSYENADKLKSFLGWLMFAFSAVFIISLMYKYIPACKVRYKYAFKAALIAGIIFTGLQYLYVETTVMVAKSSAIYGVLAAVPLFMVWVNWGWTIIIYGAELSYGFQTVETSNVSAQELDKRLEESKRVRKSRRGLFFKRDRGDKQ